jgi:DNA-binding transcriptional ArsR family regulator
MVPPPLLAIFATHIMLYFYNMSTSERELDKQERVFKALADYRRREMLDLLKDAPRSTGEICAHFDELDRCTVMQHLGVLEKAELVIVKRSGRNRWNYINPLPIKEIYDRWISRYATHAVGILARMKRDLEAEN